MLHIRAAFWSLIIVLICSQDVFASKKKRSKNSKGSILPSAQPQGGPGSLFALGRPFHLAPEPKSILKDPLRIMSAIARYILKAVEEGHHPSAVSLGALMQEYPITAGQSVDRYVDLSFYQLATKDCSVADALINDCIVPKFYFLKQSKYRIQSGVLSLTCSDVTVLLKDQIREFANKNGPKVPPAAAWDLIKLHGGFEIGDFENEIAAADRLLDYMGQLAPILSGNFSGIQMCHDFMKEIGAATLWEASKEISTTINFPLYSTHGFLLFSHHIYLYCHKHKLCVAKKYNKIESLLEAFSATFKGSPVANVTERVKLGPAALALTSRPSAVVPLTITSCFGLYFIDMVDSGDGEHQKLYEIIEANPINPWEHVDSYVQAIIAEYQRVDEAGAIRLLGEKIISKFAWTNVAVVTPQLYENYMAFVVQITEFYCCRRINAPKSEAFNMYDWERAKVMFPTRNSGSPGDAKLVPESFLERIFFMTDFLLEYHFAIPFCCHFLQEIGPYIVWDIFRDGEYVMCQIEDFLDFAQSVYAQLKSRVPEVARIAMKRTLGHNKNDATGLGNFTPSKSNYHTWKWP